MKKLIYLLMLVSGSLFAQDFDFKCADISDQEALDMAIADADEKHDTYVTTDWASDGSEDVIETYTYSNKTVTVRYSYDIVTCRCEDRDYVNDVNSVDFTIGSLSKRLYIQRTTVPGCGGGSFDFTTIPCGY